MINQQAELVRELELRKPPLIRVLAKQNYERGNKESRPGDEGRFERRGADRELGEKRGMGTGKENAA